VLKGWLRLQYNGQELTLRKDKMFIYLPGLSVTVLEASADYRGICLLADEGYTLELPVVRNAIRTAYFPLLEFGNPRLALQPDDSRHLEQLMRLAIRYLLSPHPSHSESLRLLYSLFLVDLSAIEDRSVHTHRFSPRVEELFLRFIQLLPQQFVEHRDIGFYASELCITTTYLSRVVRQVSGRTVADYIDQMLLMESAWLLQTSSLTISQIADRLHFADSTTFARFFKRLKGCTPKEYRLLGMR
ncbi:MAG: helix-turn-helix transcriptional regulator, partial [Prevotella sp.]